MADAWYVVTHLASGWNFHEIATPQFLLRQMPVALGAILVLEIGQLWGEKVALPTVGRMSLVPRWACYAAFVMLALMFGIYQKMQFIYFQF
jgi:hypothetical protein